MHVIIDEKTFVPSHWIVTYTAEDETGTRRATASIDAPGEATDDDLAQGVADLFATAVSSP